jgi:hypothetical protein
VGASSEEEGRKKGMEDENRGELSIENRHDNFMFHECHGYLGSESVGMGWGENEDEDEDECSRGGRRSHQGNQGGGITSLFHHHQIPSPVVRCAMVRFFMNVA